MILTAEQILDLRKSTGLSQAEFAKKIGVSQGAVAKWELGIRHPKYVQLVRLAGMYEKMQKTLTP